MAENRFGCRAEELNAYQRKNFLNGPGKVCAALGIDRSLNGLPWGSRDLFVCGSLEDIGADTPAEDLLPLAVRTGTRIGVAYAEECAGYPWRFYTEGQEHVHF